MDNKTMSIIICSTHTQLDDDVKKNIEETIGIPHDIVFVDNSANEYTIFQAYNKGVREAKGDILCFMHEDIIYHSKNWGKKVCRHFERTPQLGLIGVAGGTQVLPIGDWRLVGNNVYTHYIQGITAFLEHSRYYTIEQFSRKKQFKNNAKEVIAIDGMWFCIPKSLFTQIQFDETTYKGFHLYDTDISMEVHKAGYKAAVINDIIIEHKSEGSFREDFFTELDKFHAKWKEYLPASTTDDINDAEELNRLMSMAKDKMSTYIKLNNTEYNIRQKIIKYSLEDVLSSLTKEEFNIMSRKVYRQTKSVIKTKNISNRNAWSVCHGTKICYNKSTYYMLMIKLMFYRVKLSLSLNKNKSK